GSGGPLAGGTAVERGPAADPPSPMPLVPVLLAWASLVISWGGHGFPTHPLWLLALVPLLFWIFAAHKKERRWLELGFVGLVFLAAASAARGAVAAGFGGIGFALLAWDSADLLHWRGEKERLYGLAGRGLLRSGLAVGAGCILGFVAVRLRLTLPFWGLVGVLASVWLGLWAWTHSVQRRGGEANGNRSESGPTR
ncbi:MAG: hypothetical protein ACK42E_04960, partial [Candidatus Bipolaricaulaceae bacterium]